MYKGEKKLFHTLFLQTETCTSLQKGRIHCRVLGIHALSAGYYNNIVAGFQGRGVESVNLAKSASYPVSHHGMTQLCGYGITETVILCAVASAIDDHVRGDCTLSLRVQTPEITVLF